MSKGLLEQLDLYGGDFESALAPIELEGVLSDSTVLESIRSPDMRLNRIPGWVLALAAAIVVVVLIGGVAWLSQSPVDPVDQRPGPVDSLQDLSSGWSPARSDVSTRGMADVAVGGPGFVAVGESNAVGTVWTSTDGVSWTARSFADLGLEGGSMFSVVRGGPGFVAVGSWSGVATEGVGILDEAEYEVAAVWTSVDGIDWTRVPHTPVFAAEGRNVITWDVTTGGPGLVAVGAEEGPGGIRAAVWTSPDGLKWSRVPPDAPAFTDGAMDHIVAGGPGLVAWGSDIWVSDDGIIWKQALVPDNISQADIEVGGPGLVAVGGAFTAEMDAVNTVVWTSADGMNWERQEGGTGFEGGMESVVDVGPGLLATGSNPSAANDWTPVPQAWISEDGKHWQQLPDVGVDTEIFRVVVSDSALIALTHEGSWVWSPPEP